LHRHQREAVEVARAGANYVLTTGTGSGKSLAYLVPIVDHVLRNGSGKGIQAIVVYPMNALANSQAGELEKFLSYGPWAGADPVTFRRYTGQETDEERQAILASPPDILLTNYVMLELILTRPYEDQIVKAARGLRFLVLDELHTYRGRQGADVALLGRRVREACNASNLQVVGTSATLAGSGTIDAQRAEVAGVATLLFGANVEPTNVIGETLRRATTSTQLDDPAFIEALRTRVAQPAPEGLTDFRSDPVASWIETTFGLETELSTGTLRRAAPRPITGTDAAADALAAQTGLSAEQCADAIRDTLMCGYKITQENGFPVFAFRVHQFFSRGETVYASLESEADRYVTTSEQQYVPGAREKVLFPLAFCRECGQEYYTVRTAKDEGGASIVAPRPLSDTTGDDDSDAGFLYAASDHPWPVELEAMLERLPDEWLEPHGDSERVKANYRQYVPRALSLKTDGQLAEDGLQAHWVPAPFRFCLRCGVSHGGRQPRDFGKLMTLGAGGRSSATTILGLAAIRSLRSDSELKPEARKLLSFTDNRQDASLQAGHFNDFVEVGLIRSALFRAAAVAGAQGLAHDELALKAFDALGLPIELYSVDPTVRFGARQEVDRALRDVLGYRLYRDLERGWRITAPNLEQSGLLKIEYASLDELCEAEDVWEPRQSVLANASPADRQKIATVLLDLMRRELAVRVDYLSGTWQEALKQRSSQYLVDPWAIDEEEELVHASVLFPKPRRRAAREYRGNVYVSARGGLGQYLRRPNTFTPPVGKLTLDDTETIIRDLLEALRVAGLVVQVEEQSDDDGVPGYQLAASAMRWHAGDGTRAYHDPIRIPSLPEDGGRTNPYFIAFYRGVAADGQGLEAREHTAQVPPAERQQREDEFREGKLPILFCSPTMELGVDIAELNVVNMRNIPPTPANYAQRSGRAGRSGQPALVFNYCAAGSSHDQYFFRRPRLMVSGQVKAPRLDLANEDLVRAHVHAIWLAETGVSLGSSLADVLELDLDDPSYPLRESIAEEASHPEVMSRTKPRAERFLATIAQLDEAEWYSPSWLDDRLREALLALDRACDRWRELYQAAIDMRESQHKIVTDHSRSPAERNLAKRLRAQSEAQIDLLRGGDQARQLQSDFYSYRYFASEGFLPGYSFPRLPLSAFIPARRGSRGKDEFLQRPRFLAISEFGPRSIVYHEGSRYVINRVFLPVERSEDNRLPTSSVKQCSSCGYLHPVENGDPGLDVCEQCGAPLDPPITKLFRLQNVATKRRDRINSDEEDRVRQGFDIQTGVRFAELGGLGRRVAHVVADGTTWGKLTFGGAATLWRINLGWKRRKDPNVLGFVLDTERGYWAQNVQAAVEDQGDAMSQLQERVVPYVEDRRNALLFEPARPIHELMPSLAAALKSAIQITFDLEDSELAVEPLPSRDFRRQLLFYEAAEGGAGVLRQLASDPDALARVARRALELCHFDPATGADLHHAPGAREDCEAACYDCLMSYANQSDHRLLDRHAIVELLQTLAGATVEVSPGSLPRPEQLERLRAACGSGLEKKWLDEVENRGLNLPTHAQLAVSDARARPDFTYLDRFTAVFIDGPPHDYSDVHVRDGLATVRLEDAGYTVIRFPHDQPWDPIFASYPSVFGGSR
jgi:very-short-patch-repair endonuclease